VSLVGIVRAIQRTEGRKDALRSDKVTATLLDICAARSSGSVRARAQRKLPTCTCTRPIDGGINAATSECGRQCVALERGAALALRPGKMSRVRGGW
jgi:hypothetical protein